MGHANAIEELLYVRLEPTSSGGPFDGLSAYVAGPSTPEGRRWVRRVINRLRRQGCAITRDWIPFVEAVETLDIEARGGWNELGAEADISGVRRADFVIACHADKTEGMHTEIGAAIALEIPIVGAGRPTFFGALAALWFGELDELERAIEHAPARILDVAVRSVRLDDFRALQAEAHAIARAKGWWDSWDEGPWVICPGCGSYIDPECCGCGSPRFSHHSQDHGFIPLGCDCYRCGPPNERPTRDELQHASRVIVQLALITSEVSEAIEAVRGGAFDETVLDEKPEGLPAELADVVIRCLDLAEGLGLDLAAAIERKMAYNRGRPVRHGGKLA